MIFNPVRYGQEKEYAITARGTVSVSATTAKAGHRFRVTPKSVSRTVGIEFIDPDTGETVTIMGAKSGAADFVMPAADVTAST